MVRPSMLTDTRLAHPLPAFSPSMVLFSASSVSGEAGDEAPPKETPTGRQLSFTWSPI